MKLGICLACWWIAAKGIYAAAEPSVAVTFHEHLAPVLFQHCVPCHRPGGAAPFPLLTFGDAAKRATDLADVTGRRYMPPWLPVPGPHAFSDERRLSGEEIAFFRRWADTGAPEGDAAKATQPPVFSSEWQLGPPDLIVTLPEPYSVPPEGKDVYRNFVVPLDLTQRRYVKAWELRPHSRAAHHAFVRVDRSGEGRRRDATDPEPGFFGMDLPVGIQPPNGHFASWQPGAAPTQNPPGLAWTLEPGTDLVLQTHLQPIGKPEPFRPQLGLYFTDESPTNQPIKFGLGTYVLDIPAGSTNVIARDELLLPADVDLLGVLPHTHYLGHRIESRAIYPDGRQESLLQIPDWDFNWQGAYRYREPVFLPAGTRITMAIQFDNSTNNVRNPYSPPRPARYGPNTTDEMAELWLQLLPRTADGAAKLERLLLERTTRDTIAYAEQRLRRDPNDGGALVNLGRARLAQQRLTDAEGLFKHATRIAPQLDDAHYYLGLIYRMTRRRSEAIQEFRRTLELNPQHARANGNLGLLEMESGHANEAAAYFREAIRIDPRDALALQALADIRLQQGARNEAIELYRRILEVDNEHAEARAALARLGQSP